MKFYAINQNNSGGYVIQNEFVDHIVCVEADNAESAEDLLSRFVEDYGEYCECCGERWYINLNKDDGRDYIHDGYGNKLEDIDPNGISYYATFVVIYYANGDKKKFNAKTKEFTDLGKWI